MRNNKKIYAGILALLMSVGMLVGCDKNKNNEPNDTTSSTVISGELDLGEDRPTQATTREVAEGDVHAIYKLSGQPTEDFSLAYSDEMITAYLNGVAKIEIFGANYKEDYTDLASYADTACANLKFQNMTLACDTEFEEPVNTKIAGFDAIYYDYLVIANEFDDNKEKHEIARHKARIVFFYSDEDVYYINVQSLEDTWDENLPKFEAFLDSIVIDKNAKEPEKTNEGTIGVESNTNEELVEDISAE